MKDIEYYLGRIREVTDPDLYTVTVDVPGVFEGVPAWPDRTVLDEPRPGDVVLLMGLDPVFRGSTLFYRGLKENGFIGIRARGKKIEVTPEKVEIGIYPVDTKYTDADSPTSTSWVRIGADGTLDMSLESGATVKVGAGGTLEVKGDLTVKVTGNVNLEASGGATVKSPSVKVTGGTLEVAGTAGATGTGGFCAIPVCPFSGAPHVGNKISGT